MYITIKEIAFTYRKHNDWCKHITRSNVPEKLRYALYRNDIARIDLTFNKILIN